MTSSIFFLLLFETFSQENTMKGAAGLEEGLGSLPTSTISIYSMDLLNINY